MRVITSGMTVTVAAENKASGPRNALDVWHPPAKCLIVCQFSHNGTLLALLTGSPCLPLLLDSFLEFKWLQLAFAWAGP